MNDVGTTQSTLQAVLLRMYTGFNVRALRRSRIGDWLFERAYVAYKIALEAGPIASLSQYVTPHSWVIDVGANIGVFTLPLSRFVKGGCVVAVEPEASNFAALQRRVKAAGVEARVHLHHGVAAETNGTLHLAINPGHPGDHKLADSGVAVRASTLDSIVESHGHPPVSFIKIDVQGAELRVLTGASELIRRCQPALLVEVDDAALRRQGASALLLLQWLGERGYRPYRFQRGRPVEALSEEEVVGTTSYLDVLFLHGLLS